MQAKKYSALAAMYPEWSGLEKNGCEKSDEG